MEEFIDIVDEKDNVVGKEEKKIVERKALFHRAVFIFIFNSEGKLFVQKRSKHKFLAPGLYGIGAGGSVRAGESYDEAAARELAEELGIKNIKLDFMFNFTYRAENDNYNSKVYKGIYDGEIKIQEDEIEHGEFKTIDEIRQMSEEGKLCPDTALFFEKYLELEK